MLECLDEDVLRQIHCVLTMLHEAVTDPVNLTLVPDHDFVEGARIPRKIPFDKLSVGILTTGGHRH